MWRACFGAPARTLVPEWLPENKTKAILNYGVEPVRVSLDDLLAYMLEERWKQEPYTYLNPWGDPRMIAGHGTIGLEILADHPDVETVYVPVGGGALVCGISAALKALKPDIRVVGVQSEVNPSLAVAFEAGGPLWIEHKPTVCEGASLPLVVAEMYPPASPTGRRRGPRLGRGRQVSRAAPGSSQQDGRRGGWSGVPGRGAQGPVARAGQDGVHYQRRQHRGRSADDDSFGRRIVGSTADPKEC